MYQLLTLGVAEDVAEQAVDMAHHRRELVGPNLVDSGTEVVIARKLSLA